MVTISKSTKPISGKTIKREWHLINVKGKVLGRISPEICHYLQGKHKVDYSPNLDMGDYVVAINAKQVVLTGNKTNAKVYKSFSGYPGGLREISFKKMIEKNPGEVLRRAVSGMLPKNKLRDKRLARFYIYANEKHPYEDKFIVTNKK